MAPIISLVATLVVSLLVTRIGAVAFQLTGLSREVARFQARSAFTGVGFTTNEAEKIVNHPVRRKIAGLLMLAGNLGIAFVIASLIAAVSITEEGGRLIQFFLLLAGLGVLYIIGTRTWVDQTISYIIEWALLKWTTLDVRDYVSLLHLADGYVVLELVVKESDWISNRSLSEARLSAEGVLVLGLHRAGGKYIGSPNGETMVKTGDTLSLYGPIDRLEELDLRQKGYDGDRAHRIAVATQSEQLKDQNNEEEERRTDANSQEATSNS
jgi:hypothetical protein